MKRILFIVFICYNSFCSYAQQDQPLPKGVIIDSVKVAKSAGETYAFYLPSQYDSNIPSAIVFILEPAAKGRVGIQPFVLAAETYNYILVCSNNSKNGPSNINLAIADRLFNDVLGKYNINQLYISGFSGGARLAGSIAVSSGAFQGVIACGASFLGMDKFALQGHNFSYVGMVGEADMNYQEMIENKAWLDRMKINNILLISHEDHTWPNEKEMLRAFDWLEIQAYKKNIRIKNERVMKQIYDKDLRIADSLSKNNEMIAAVEEYERCNAIYDNNGNDNIGSTIATIKSSAAYKNEVKKREETKILENKMTNVFLVQFDKELQAGKSKDDFKFWKNELKKLNDRKFLSSDISTINMINRIQFKIWVMVYETAEESKRNQEYDKLNYCRELEKIIELYQN